MSASEIEYRPVGAQDFEAVRQFLCEVGWQRRVGDAERFRRIVEGAQRTVVAFDGGRVVGFARALCDGVSNGYISTVEVRGRGVGRELVRRLVGEDAGITWVLRAGHGSEGFWKRMGFEASEVAMERVRQTD